MKKKMLAVLLAGVMCAFSLTACGGDDTAAADTEDYAEEEEYVEEDTEEVADEAEASDELNISYVDGFYATEGDSDFMIAFYEGDAGDVAYVNDGTSEAVAEYTVEEAALDDGTPYYLVTVGGLQLGYYEDGDDIYFVDDEGNIYAAARLSEDEADALYAAVAE